LRTPLLAEIVLMEPSSGMNQYDITSLSIVAALPLVHSPKLLVLDDHFEKSSTLTGPWQAPRALAVNPAQRPIKFEKSITKR
jgi:hypothetical protein